MNGLGAFAVLLSRGSPEAINDPALKPALQADLDAVAASARTAAGQADAELPGWYCYTHADCPAAQQWFRMALAGGAGQKAAEGQVLALRDGNRIDDARRMNKRRLNHKEPGGLAVIRGWAQYHQDDWAEAEKTFAGLDRGKLSEQRAEGLRLIHQGFTNPRSR